jgi:Protein of unknown function (DUF2934)
MTDRKGISTQDIARRAYVLYAERGRENGKDVDDWVRAEEELWAEATYPAVRSTTTHQV